MEEQNETADYNRGSRGRVSHAGLSLDGDGDGDGDGGSSSASGSTDEENKQGDVVRSGKPFRGVTLLGAADAYDGVGVVRPGSGSTAASAGSVALASSASSVSTAPLARQLPSAEGKHNEHKLGAPLTDKAPTHSVPGTGAGRPKVL